MKSWLGALAVSSGLALAGTAYAQAPPPQEAPARPYRGLFGGNSANPRSAHSLDLSLSAMASYDDNTYFDQPGAGGNPLAQASGYVAAGSAQVSYKRGRGVKHVELNVREDFRGYWEDPDLNNYGTYADLGIGIPLGRRNRAGLGANYSYGPFFVLETPAGLPPVADPAPTPSPDLAIKDLRSTGYAGSARIERDFSNRTTMSAGYSYEATDYPSTTLATAQDSFYHRANVRWSRTMSRNGGLKASYQYNDGELQNRPYTEHYADFGFNIERRLSPTRYLRLEASAGASRTDYIPYGTEEFTKADRFVASASGSVDLARTWALGGRYERSVKLIPYFPDPAYGDSYGVFVNGLFGSRVDFNANAAYTAGDTSLDTGGRTYDTYGASARTRFALSRFSAIFVTYAFYRYDYTKASAIPEGYPPKLDRQVVALGMTLWVPLLR